MCLFVGTKKQAQDAIREEATRCGMYYVHNRWLGGTLTNFTTIRQSIERLRKIEEMENDPEDRRCVNQERDAWAATRERQAGAIARRDQGDAQAARRDFRDRSQARRNRG